VKDIAVRLARMDRFEPIRVGGEGFADGVLVLRDGGDRRELGRAAVVETLASDLTKLTEATRGGAWPACRICLSNCMRRSWLFRGRVLGARTRSGERTNRRTKKVASRRLLVLFGAGLGDSETRSGFAAVGCKTQACKANNDHQPG